MMKMKYRNFAGKLVMVLLLAALAVPASAKDSGNEVGIVLGYFFPGTMYVEPVDVDWDGGLLFRGFADMKVAEKMYVGAYLNYVSGSISYGGYSVDGEFYEFGGALKFIMHQSSSMKIKPGLNIGYRKLSADNLEDSDGLGINLSVEFHIPMSGGYAFLADIGFLSQPTGGNEFATVTWAPIIYASAGILF